MAANIRGAWTTTQIERSNTKSPATITISCRKRSKTKLATSGEK